MYDPEIGISVIDMGMVRKIREVEDGILITIILTTPTCPLAQTIMEQVRAAAQAVTERPVEVVMGMETWDPSMMSSEASS